MLWSMLRIRYLLEYLPLYLIYCLCRVLGFSKASALGGFVGRTAGYAYAQLSGVADNNIRRVFPKLSTNERRNLIKKACDNMGRTFFEYFVLDIADRDPKFKCTQVNGKIMELMAEDKPPIMLFSAHLGNWEVGAKNITDSGYSLTPIYRPINNPYVDALILKCRGRVVTSQIAKGRRSGIESIRTLKAGTNMVVLADQKYNEGLDIPFFGVSAKTADGFVKLAKASGAKIVPIVITRHNKTEFIVRLSAHIMNPEIESIEEILTKCNSHIEDWIKTYPEQWFWFHRRWDKKLYKKQ